MQPESKNWGQMFSARSVDGCKLFVTFWIWIGGVKCLIFTNIQYTKRCICFQHWQSEWVHQPKFRPDLWTNNSLFKFAVGPWSWSRLTLKIFNPILKFASLTLFCKNHSQNAWDSRMAVCFFTCSLAQREKKCDTNHIPRVTA